MAEEFTQNKPPLKVVLMGHEGHGKTTLIAALKHVVSLDDTLPPAKGKSAWGRFSAAIGQAISGDARAQEPMPTPVAGVQNPGQGSDKRSFEFLDAPASGVPDLIDKAAGTGGAALILVVAVTDGPMPQTQEHVQRAKQAGASGMVVFINYGDLVDDEEMNDLVEMELRELLNANGFDGTSANVTRGSARMALQARSSDDPWAKKLLVLSASLNGLDAWR